LRADGALESVGQPYVKRIGPEKGAGTISRDVANISRTSGVALRAECAAEKNHGAFGDRSVISLENETEALFTTSI
jgi:hypothetical protein